MNIALTIGAVMSFAMTLMLLLLNQASSAGVALTLTFGLLLFRVLPELEFFRIFGLEARLRKKLGEAEAITQQLQEITRTLSRLGVSLIATSNRFGGMSVSEKNAQYSSIVSAMRLVSVSEREIEEISRPHLAYTALDLYFSFTRLVNHRLEKYRKAVIEGEARCNRERLKDYKDANDNFDVISIKFSEPTHEDPRLKEVEKLCESYLCNYNLDPADEEAFRNYASKIGEMASRVWSEKGVPTDVQEHIAKMHQPIRNEQILDELLSGKSFTWAPFYPEGARKDDSAGG